jgi:hypothetical protein
MSNSRYNLAGLRLDGRVRTARSNNSKLSRRFRTAPHAAISASIRAGMTGDKRFDKIVAAANAAKFANVVSALAVCHNS